MTAATKPVNRLVLNGCEYPRKLREQKPEALPPPFDKLLAGRLKELPFNQARPDMKDTQLLDLFMQTVHLLRGRTEEWNQMLRQVFLSNVEVRLAPWDPKKAAELRQQKYDAVFPSVPALEVEEPDFLDWELFAKPAAEIHAFLAAYCGQAARRMVGRFFESLDALTDARAIGLVEHSAKPGVCRYWFYRWVTVQEETGKDVQVTPHEKEKTTFHGSYFETVTEQWQRKTTTRQLQRTHRNARHEHHLVDATWEWWNGGMKKPSFVSTLLGRMPAWVRNEYVTVVGGTMVKEAVVEVDSKVEEWAEKDEEDIKVGQVVRTGRLGSPCVCLGHFALCGWSQADMHLEATRGAY